MADVKAGGDVDPVDSSGGWKLHLLSSLGMRGDGGDEEELRMLASLKREQEEDECKAPGLSASQIRQCNVGVSVSCGDASTWTHVSMVCSIHLICSLIFFYMPPPDTHTPTNPTTPASLALRATAHPYTIISRLFLLLAVMVNNFHDPG